MTAYDRTWKNDRYRNDPEYRRAQRGRQLKKKYGIEIQDYDAMLLAQGCVCAICGKAEDSNSFGAKFGTAQLAVDHDHAAGTVRGLLCADCNRVLGIFKDDAERFVAAAVYLMRTTDVIGLAT